MDLPLCRTSSAVVDRVVPSLGVHPAPGDVRVSLTAAATWAGFVLGLQPILYKDANGLPLYMPYPLSVTVPAMFLEHGLAFSILEALVTALIFAYIRKTDPSLLYGEESEAQKSRTKRAAPS